MGIKIWAEEDFALCLAIKQLVSLERICWKAQAGGSKAVQAVLAQLFPNGLWAVTGQYHTCKIGCSLDVFFVSSRVQTEIRSLIAF